MIEENYDLCLDQQIELLRSQNFSELNIEYLIEELEGLNKSNERELESYLIVLIAHLLKWEYQPSLQCGSWRGSILNSRNRIAKLLKQQPSLKRKLPEIIPEAYGEAKEWASAETGMKIILFPLNCPYEASELMDKNWLP
ncbi:hypothetical protein STA3757_10080 [Stanieria sp. NIES-3757]|nr:hypothetical protein STA3757_10080 [Stanieria sp. NIES-3757]